MMQFDEAKNALRKATDWAKGFKDVPISTSLRKRSDGDWVIVISIPRAFSENIQPPKDFDTIDTSLEILGLPSLHLMPKMGNMRLG